MAVRLTVIMIESPPPTAAAGRLAEEIVGNLIGRAGDRFDARAIASGLGRSLDRSADPGRDHNRRRGIGLA